MDCYITYFIEGFIAFNEDLQVIAFNKFSPDKRALNIIQLEKKEFIPEEIAIIEQLQEEYENIFIESNKRTSDYSDFENIVVQTPNPGGNYLRENFDKFLEMNEEEFNETYRKIALYKMKEKSKSEDKHLIQAINSIDDIDEAISKLVERIREWYALYFPEMDNIKNNETYIKLIAENETKQNIIKSKPEAFLLDFEEFDEEIKKEDLEIINDFATSIYELQKTRKKTEEYIENKMDSIAPNLKNLVGASLGAKLISHAGGIKRLSTYPSSTVQIMGAEKALFRHLKNGDRPPKYGLIYQHPAVRGSKWWNRGKIARMLASKISLAVRKDVYSDDIDPNIYDNFIEKAEQIEKEHPFPPTKNQKKKGKSKKSKKSKRRK